ncbi:MAG TPA: hypothetical protein VLC71_01360 [Thermomonas sp.]|nr:hypothetical protein [Thermomonas sp.]
MHHPAMRILSAPTLAAALLLAVLPAVPHRAEADTGVLRCRMPDGTSAYTSKACSAFGGQAIPMQAEVLARIERDQRREARLAGIERPDAASQAQPLQASVRRSVQGGCASSPQQLATDLVASVAMRDVNRVAESFDWAGMRHAQALQVMTDLERLSLQVVVDTEYFDATIGGAALLADARSSVDAAAGLMQVTFTDRDVTSVLDFEVMRDEGCYFLRY